MTELDKLIQPQNASSFCFSAENPQGLKGGGSRGAPNQKLSAAILLKPGETKTLADAAGPGFINSMWFSGYTGPDFILRIYWDGQAEPAVEVPLCAFFGFAFGSNVTDCEGRFPVLSSAAVNVNPAKGFSCFWKMPFRQHCRLTLENRNPKQTRDCYYTILGAYAPVPSDCLYFCASYRQQRPVPADQEYVVIDGIKGQGHFVGLTLAVTLGRNNGCWVEGEPKMYIDGDKYPSINFTGTEDYFLGAFCFGKDNPALNRVQTYSGLYSGLFAEFGSCPNNAVWASGERYASLSRFLAYRWHIQDPICFQKDFRMTLQDLEYAPDFGWRSRSDDYLTVAYWYQTLPIAPFKELPAEIEMDFA